MFFLLNLQQKILFSALFSRFMWVSVRECVTYLERQSENDKNKRSRDFTVGAVFIVSFCSWCIWPMLIPRNQVHESIIISLVSATVYTSVSLFRRLASHCCLLFHAIVLLSNLFLAFRMVPAINLLKRHLVFITIKFSCLCWTRCVLVHCVHNVKCREREREVEIDRTGDAAICN